MCLHLCEGMLPVRDAHRCPEEEVIPWIGVTGSCESPDEVLESELSFFGRTGSTLA